MKTKQKKTNTMTNTRIENKHWTINYTWITTQLKLICILKFEPCCRYPKYLMKITFSTKHNMTITLNLNGMTDTNTFILWSQIKFTVPIEIELLNLIEGQTLALQSNVPNMTNLSKQIEHLKTNDGIHIDTNHKINFSVLTLF